MSIARSYQPGKRCFVYCGPERCNCRLASKKYQGGIEMRDRYLPSEDEPGQDILISLNELATKRIPSAPMYARAAAEIERLRAENTRLIAGGCARDQTTTQFCAEAVALQAENARLREALEGFVAHYPHGINPDLDRAYSAARKALKGE